MKAGDVLFDCHVAVETFTVILVKSRLDRPGSTWMCDLMQVCCRAGEEGVYVVADAPFTERYLSSLTSEPYGTLDA